LTLTSSGILPSFVHADTPVPSEQTIYTTTPNIIGGGGTGGGEEILIPEDEFSVEGYQLYLSTPIPGTPIFYPPGEEPDPEVIEALGLKKKAVVYALRHGGSLLSKLTELVSSKNAKLIMKHSDELADALERFSNAVEARLIDFMIFDLGLPSSSARSIAWAICFLAL
jgi:hypothetical protein